VLEALDDLGVNVLRPTSTICFVFLLRVLERDIASSCCSTLKLGFSSAANIIGV